MIDVQNNANRSTRLVVQANQSMSWKANMWLAFGLAFVSLGIAFSLAFMGYWMVIPFAGAEIIFVVICLHWTLHKLSHKEIITVSDEDIRLEWGYNSPERSVDLPRRWSKLRFDSPENDFEVGTLKLGAHGKYYALGQSLGKAEKKVLHRELKQALQRV